MPRLAALLLLTALPLAGGAQPPAAVVAPGMDRAAVVSALGAPVVARRVDAQEFLFYRNGCERRCGTLDVVILEEGKVADAILRSPRRRYDGVSSSPSAIPAARARRPGLGTPAAPTAVPPATSPR